MNSKQADNPSSAFERELNEALVNANIANGYEEFLALFDRFYAEQVEVASDGPAAALAGKSRVLSVLFNFLVPLHVMAEICGLPPSPLDFPPPIRQRPEGQTQRALPIL